MIGRGIQRLYVCCIFAILSLIILHVIVEKSNITSSIIKQYIKHKVINIYKEELLKEDEKSDLFQKLDYDGRTSVEKTTSKQDKMGRKMVEKTDLLTGDRINCGNSSGLLKCEEKKKRKLIFILAQGRSGSTLLGDLFNRDEKAFYIFEPFLPVERLNNMFYFETDNKTILKFYEKEAISFLTGLATCVSNKEFEKYMNVYDEFGSRSRTASFSKAPFQSVWINSNLVIKFCNNQTTYTAIKELEFRLPDKRIETLVNLSESLNLDLRLIHLVRDPRAYLLSQMKLQWFFEDTNLTKRRMDRYVQNRCMETFSYLKEIAIMKEKFKGKMKYLLLRYEDLIDYPSENLKKISNMTGIDVYTAAKDWFGNMTSGKDLGEKNRYQNGARNASIVKVAWKAQIRKNLLDTIQKECGELMKELKYTLYTI